MTIIELHSMTLVELFLFSCALLKDLQILLRSCQNEACELASEQAKKGIRDCNSTLGILRPYACPTDHSASFRPASIRVGGAQIPVKSIAINSIEKALRAQSAAVLLKERAVLQRIQKVISRQIADLEAVIPPPNDA